MTNLSYNQLKNEGDFEIYKSTDLIAGVKIISYDVYSDDDCVNSFKNLKDARDWCKMMTF